MKKIIFLSLAALFIMASSTNTFAQKNAIVKSPTAQKVEKSRGGDNPNITTPRPTTDVLTVPAPSSRGGDASRGAYCDIKFENWTGYYIDIYVDGTYQGTVSPWQDYYAYEYSGYKSIYCETVGGTYYWSDNGNCDGEYTFKMSE